MNALSECPACHYQGAALPYNGADQVQCPRCERIYVAPSVDSVSSSHFESGEESGDELAQHDAETLAGSGELSTDGLASQDFRAPADSDEESTDETNDGDSVEPMDDEEFEDGEDADDSDESPDDEEDQTAPQRSGRIIRMHCPNCGTMVELSRRTEDVTVSALWDRMQLHNEAIRVRCPVCCTLVQLQRRRNRQSELSDLPTHDSTALGPPEPAHEMNNGLSHPPVSLSNSNHRSPSLAWQLLWPERFRLGSSRDESKSRSSTTNHRRQPRPLPLKYFAVGAILAAAMAVAVAWATTYGVAVTPLSILAVVIALGTLWVAHATQSPLRWELASVLVTVAVLVFVEFYPTRLGEKYTYYRNPELDPEFVTVTPKIGRHDKEIPMDPNWVDASKFGLDRDWFHIQVNLASMGPVEVRSLSGGPPKIEPHLAVAFSYGSVRQSKRGENPSEEQSGKLAVSILDSEGRSYEREDLILTSQLARLKESRSYTSGSVDETMIFKCPSVGEDGLRLEIRVPNLGTTPLRFTIPKTMISTVSAPTTPSRTPGERPKEAPSRNDE